MRLILAVLLVLMAFPAFAQTGAATLTCTPPTQNTNGTPIAGAISYKFYRGASQSGPFNLETKTSSTCGVTFTGLSVGTHYFVATATVNGVESAISNTANGVVSPIPNAPTGLSVSVSVTVTVNP